MRTLTIWGLVLLIVATGCGAAAAAQGCDDCRELKKEYRDSALARYTAVAAQPTPTPSVRLILYWTKGCGHCEALLEGVLPEFQKKYGAQLEVRLVEVVTLENISAFNDLAQGYGYARGKAAVPFLLIGDRALMGTDQIKAELAGLVDVYLAAGGSDWPVAGGVRPTPRWIQPADAGCSVGTPCADGPAPAGTAPTTGPQARDGLGPSLATLGLAAVVGGGLLAFRRRRAIRHAPPNSETDGPSSEDRTKRL